MHALWSRGASDERIQALLVEGADGVASRLRGAPQTLGYLRRRAAAGAGDSILDRRITKLSLERSPAWRLSRSFSDNFWTNSGGFMKGTIAHHTQPSLSMH